MEQEYYPELLEYRIAAHILSAQNCLFHNPFFMDEIEDLLTVVVWESQLEKC